MKIHIKDTISEDAIRIELHLTIKYDDGCYYADEKFKHRIEELVKEGVIDIR